jgi:hypothetical protein
MRVTGYEVKSVYEEKTWNPFRGKETAPCQPARKYPSGLGRMSFSSSTFQRWISVFDFRLFKIDEN